jgi:hypothetical protein
VRHVADTLAQHRCPLAQPMMVRTMDSLQCDDGGRDGGDDVVLEGVARARQSSTAGSDPALWQGWATLPGVRAPLPPWPARAGHDTITAWARLCRSASVRDRSMANARAAWTRVERMESWSRTRRSTTARTSDTTMSRGCRRQRA